MVVQRHYVVTGRVQGVWFRASARQEGQRLGLLGWVRNRPDGSVEAMAQGETGAVESLEEWLHRGPELARVDGVEVREVSVDPGLGPFCVR